jgi:tetraacyldisaccharide 4'-kinase
MNSLDKFWYTKHPISYALLPLSYLYRAAFLVHKYSYKLGLKKKFCSPIPVVVIGNLTVGGTGKTPFTIALAELLLKQGYHPGIISRGYKGTAKVYPQQVMAMSDPHLVGDEPVLLARKTACPVVVGPKRAAAIKLLLEQNHCDLILLDDGLQHHAVKKDIEIVIIHGQRKFGNGFCLPAGPLRESKTKLSKVDFCVYKENAMIEPYSFSTEPGKIYNLLDPVVSVSPDFFRDQKIHAVAGIGHPQQFFTSLQRLGLNIIPHAFPDHHRFRSEDFLFDDQDLPIIMTEKDAVKCQLFSTKNFWILPIQTKLSEAFIKDFCGQLGRLVRL